MAAQGDISRNFERGVTENILPILLIGQRDKKSLRPAAYRSWAAICPTRTKSRLWCAATPRASLLSLSFAAKNRWRSSRKQIHLGRARTSVIDHPNRTLNNSEIDAAVVPALAAKAAADKLSVAPNGLV
jgi:hypothetical protein